MERMSVWKTKLSTDRRTGRYSPKILNLHLSSTPLSSTSIIVKIEMRLKIVVPSRTTWCASKSQRTKNMRAVSLTRLTSKSWTESSTGFSKKASLQTPPRVFTRLRERFSQRWTMNTTQTPVARKSLRWSTSAETSASPLAAISRSTRTGVDSRTDSRNRPRREYSSIYRSLMRMILKITYRRSKFKKFC